MARASAEIGVLGTFWMIDYERNRSDCFRMVSEAADFLIGDFDQNMNFSETETLDTAIPKYIYWLRMNALTSGISLVVGVYGMVYHVPKLLLNGGELLILKIENLFRSLWSSERSANDVTANLKKNVQEFAVGAFLVLSSAFVALRLPYCLLDEIGESCVWIAVQVVKVASAVIQAVPNAYYSIRSGIDNYFHTPGPITEVPSAVLFSIADIVLQGQDGLSSLNAWFSNYPHELKTAYLRGHSQRVNTIFRRFGCIMGNLSPAWRRAFQTIGATIRHLDLSDKIITNSSVQETADNILSSEKLGYKERWFKSTDPLFQREIRNKIITDSSFADMLRCFPNIETLDLGVTGELYPAAIAMLENCPQGIKEAYLRGNSKRVNAILCHASCILGKVSLRKVSLRNVSPKWRQALQAIGGTIKELDLSDKTTTSSSFAEIVHVFSGIKTIKLINNKFSNNEGAEIIRQLIDLPLLKSLEIKNCKGIIYKDLRALKSAKPSLEIDTDIKRSRSR